MGTMLANVLHQVLPRIRQTGSGKPLALKVVAGVIGPGHWRTCRLTSRFTSPTRQRGGLLSFLASKVGQGRPAGRPCKRTVLAAALKQTPTPQVHCVGSGAYASSSEWGPAGSSSAEGKVIEKAAAAAAAPPRTQAEGSSSSSEKKEENNKPCSMRGERGGAPGLPEDSMNLPSAPLPTSFTCGVVVSPSAAAAPLPTPSSQAPAAGPRRLVASRRQKCVSARTG
ncbi:unnamed protein product [Polarella glacialis]|uniref:Uncharacterized protein n=1 Tax=Polarella glacialis TaxID=89957 RepID=A0A813GJ18_POLGL|nr:unnamed protein product [Polarella glacialis]